MTSPASAESSNRRALAACLSIAALYWIVVLLVLRAGTPSPLDDLWEYGLGARALLEGHGLRTTAIHPPLWGLRDSALTVPVLVHGPLVSMLLVPFVALAGDSALGAGAWLAALFAVAAAWGAYRLAAERFGATAGVLAALLWTFSPLTLQSVTHDVSLVVGAALLVLALGVALGERSRAFTAGLLLGLAGLARGEMIAVAPVLALASPRRAPALLLGFVIAMSPWWVHHTLATGNPLFNLSAYMLIGYRDAAPGLSPLRDFALTPERWPAVLRELLPALPREKWADFYPHAMKRLLLSPSGATGWLMVVGGAGALAFRGTRAFAALAAILLTIPVAIQCLTLYDSRYVVPFLPVGCVLAAHGLQRLWTFLPPWAQQRRAMFGALALLMLPSIAPALRECASESHALSGRIAQQREGLAPSRARAGVLEPPMFSDTPDFVAWWTHRSVIWLERAEYDSLVARSPRNAALPSPGRAADAWFEGRSLEPGSR